MSKSPPLENTLRRLDPHTFKATRVSPSSLAMDFRLPVATDATFKSSIEYDESADEVTGVALRFSDSLFDRYDDDELASKMDTLLETSGPPAGGLWTTYIRGDAHMTGPHIMTPGGFSRVDATEFANWLQRLLAAYPDVFGMPRNARAEQTENEPGTEGSRAVEVLEDDSIRFLAEYPKDDADYREVGDNDFDPDHDRCRDCVHYISGGGCHIVRGPIDPDDYCGEFYADYGVFAHRHDGYIEVNEELVSPAFDFEMRDVDDLVDGIEERLQQRIREREKAAGNPDGVDPTKERGKHPY